jgi:hypothetical protein
MMPDTEFTDLSGKPDRRPWWERARDWLRTLNGEKRAEDESGYDAREEDAGCNRCAGLLRECETRRQRTMEVIDEANELRQRIRVLEAHVVSLNTHLRPQPDDAYLDEHPLDDTLLGPPAARIEESKRLVQQWRKTETIPTVSPREPGYAGGSEAVRRKPCQRRGADVIRSCEAVTGPSHDRRWAPTNVQVERTKPIDYEALRDTLKTEE